MRKASWKHSLIPTLWIPMLNYPDALWKSFKESMAEDCILVSAQTTRTCPLLSTVSYSIGNWTAGSLKNVIWNPRIHTIQRSHTNQQYAAMRTSPTHKSGCLKRLLKGIRLGVELLDHWKMCFGTRGFTLFRGAIQTNNMLLWEHLQHTKARAWSYCWKVSEFCLGVKIKLYFHEWASRLWENVPIFNTRQLVVGKPKKKKNGWWHLLV